MKLEWFRQHKSFVYWILLPIVVVTMGLLFGTGGKFRNGDEARIGPSVTYTIDSKKYFMSPGEVLMLRTALWKLNQVREVSSGDAAQHSVSYNTALQAGIDIGTAEEKSELRETIKAQVTQRDRQAPERVDAGLYERLLKSIDISETEFERLSREQAVIRKYWMLYADSKVPDGRLFVGYSRAHETVRLRYTTLKSEDYVEKTKPPTDDDIKAFYESNKNLPQSPTELKDVMFTRPRMSADLLFLGYDVIAKDLKPTDADLKKYYDIFKEVNWRADTKPGETPPATADAKYKPFDSVKEEVVTKWREQEQQKLAREKMDALRTTLNQAVQKHETEQAGKPAAERQPFDLAAFAKMNSLVYWSTPLQTEEAYKKGKKEVNAPDANWAARLFAYANMLDNPEMKADPRFARMIPFYKKQLEEFGGATPSDNGLVICRQKEYKPAQLKTLDEAKAAIAVRIRVNEARDLTAKDAQKLADEWQKGENLKPLDQLDEVSGDQGNRNALIKQFFDTPKPIGEVLPVASESASQDPESDNPNVYFLVGFAVERKAPTLLTFDKDTSTRQASDRSRLAATDWSEESSGSGRRLGYVQLGLIKEMRRGEAQGPKDPPLGQSYRGQEE